MPSRRKHSGRRQSASSAVSPWERLQPAEARSVLEQLLQAHPELQQEADAYALELASASSFEETAQAVDSELRRLDIVELGRRAGDHGAGYVPPGEASWAACEETLDPFLEEMDRQLDLGLEADALETLRGILLGLYLAREHKGDGCLAWAPDFPLDAAREAVRRWHGHGATAVASGKRSAARRSLTGVLKFVAEKAPAWQGELERLMERIESGR